MALGNGGFKPNVSARLSEMYENKLVVSSGGFQGSERKGKRRMLLSRKDSAFGIFLLRHKRRRVVRALSGWIFSGEVRVSELLFSGGSWDGFRRVGVFHLSEEIGVPRGGVRYHRRE